MTPPDEVEGYNETPLEAGEISGPVEPVGQDENQREEVPEIEEDFAEYNDFFLAAHQGRAQIVPTEDVLGYFGRERRGARLYREVKEKLHEMGLDMFPAIEDADYYGSVKIQLENQAGEEGGSNPSPEIITSSGNSASVETYERQQRVLSSLKDDNDRLDFLTYDMSVDKAIAEMKQNGRTKMPLFFDVNNKKSLIGTVTAEKIAFSEDDNPRIIDLIGPRVPVVRTDDPLFESVEAILEHGFVYGKDSDGEVVQIYTTADVATHLNSITQMYLRVDELEELIREVLMRLDEPEIDAALSRTKSLRAIKLNDLDEKLAESDINSDDTENSSHRAERLMFSDYMKVIGDEQVWSAFFGAGNLDLDKKSCVMSLNDARKARNKVAHNNRSDIDSTIAVVEAAKAWLNYVLERKLNNS